MNERNNEERFGDIQPNQSSQGNVNQTNQSNLSFPNPTEFVDLPSEGKLYPKNHLLCGQKTLEMKFMTTKEEDILTNQSYLKKRRCYR